MSDKGIYDEPGKVDANDVFATNPRPHPLVCC